MKDEPRRAGQLAAALVLAASGGAAALTLHTALNLRLLRTPSDRPAPAEEFVSILVPVRNEADRVEPCLRSLLAQQGLPEAEILILDDGSSDQTASLVERLITDHPRASLLIGAPLPSGWLGKPHACHQLALAATGSMLVFADADVRFEPHAIAAAIEVARDHKLDLVSPYPRQIAKSMAERLIQPLLQWSWLTTLPLRAAEHSGRPSMAAANGQFLVADTAAYWRAGGHAAIRDQVLDDVALLRRITAAGGRGGMIDGTTIARCRMYRDAAELRCGYRKSLWSAFGSPGRAAGVMTGLVVLYVVPPVAALTGSRTGLTGYLAAVLGRFLIARRTQSRSLPDVLAHPLSIAALAAMTADSYWGLRRGELSWRGRPVRRNGA